MPSIQYLTALLQAYNTDADAFRDRYSIQVVESTRLIGRRSFEGLIFTAAADGSFWVVSEDDETHWLMPKLGTQVNEFSHGSLSKVFACYGYQPNSTRFKLRRPMQVNLVPGEEAQKFREEKRGILEFDQATEQELHLIRIECQVGDLEISAQETTPEFVMQRLEAIEDNIRIINKVQQATLKLLQVLQTNQDELKNQVNQSQERFVRGLRELDKLVRRIEALTPDDIVSPSPAQSEKDEKSPKPANISFNIPNRSEKSETEDQSPVSFLSSQTRSKRNSNDSTSQTSTSDGSSFARSIRRRSTALNTSTLFEQSTPQKQALAPHVQAVVHSYNAFKHDQSAFKQQYNFSPVAETRESFAARYKDRNQPAFFSRDSNGGFWAVGEDPGSGVGWLMPKGDIVVNEHSYPTITAIFECHDYRDGYRFELVAPARLYISDDLQTIELKERGELRFFP